MKTKTNTKTKHNHEVIFGRRVDGCPRCAELAAGAPARRGWGWAKKQAEAQQLRAIEAHFAPGGRYSQLKAAGMEFTDTAFEW